MKILAISTDALFTGMLHRLKREGNEIKMFIQTEAMKQVFDGIVDKVDSYEEWIDWADLIVFDDVGFGRLQDDLRKEGKLVVGGSGYFDKLESDRTAGHDKFVDMGLKTPDFHEFKSFDEAVEFVRENPGRYVVKPYGKTENRKELAYVGMKDDGSDVIAVLERYKERYPSSSEHIELEEFIDGIEVATSAYFNGGEFIYPININYEHKRFFNDDLGVNTGEQGTVMHWSHGDFRLFEEGLQKLEGELRKENYVGCIDINYIVTEENAYPLEFTNRFGYPSLFIQLEALNGRMKVADFLYGLATGELEYLPIPENEYQIGIVGNMPPYPYDCPKIFDMLSKDMPIHIPESMGDHIWLCDAYWKDGKYRLTGKIGYPFVVTARGPTVERAREMAYAYMDTVRMPNMYYRTDIGARTGGHIEMLRGWGWI